MRAPTLAAATHTAAIALLAGVCLAAAPCHAQAPQEDAAQTRRDLAEARAEGEAARGRAERFEADAANAAAAADHTARQAAALAARIQQAEAEIAAAAAEINLLSRQRAALRASVAQHQKPLLRLTAALQLLSRRPLAVAMLRPGSVRDAMHLRALLETMLPQVQARTAALRGQIARGLALQRQARAVEQAQAVEQRQLAARRQTLAGLETRQRLAARDVSGSADREAERALALSEQTRDLGTLVTDLDKAGALAGELARLPGPVPRPARPEMAEVTPDADIDNTAPVARLPAYQLPVAGRLVAGFGDGSQGDTPAQGVRIATRPGAQVVAPAPGRVAFAGPYRGFGQIVIIEHAGGWISLVTGLAALDARVGDELVAGAPLGIAGPGRPVLGLELRHAGNPVNPIDQLRGG